MTTLPDPNDVLNGGGGAPSLDMPQGVWVGGPVRAAKTYHVREYDPNNPGRGALRYFPSGDPIYGVVYDVQTSERTDADDDGVRRMFVEKVRQLNAVRDAVAAAGAKGVEIGGTLMMCHTGTERGKGANEANTYAAHYTRPVHAVPGAPAAPQPAYQMPPAQPQVPAYAPQPAYAAPAAVQAVPQPQAPAQPVITETVAAAMRNAGIPTDTYTIVPG